MGKRWRRKSGIQVTEMVICGKIRKKCCNFASFNSGTGTLSCHYQRVSFVDCCIFCILLLNFWWQILPWCCWGVARLWHCETCDFWKRWPMAEGIAWSCWSQHRYHACREQEWSPAPPSSAYRWCEKLCGAAKSVIHWNFSFRFN